MEQLEGSCTDYVEPLTIVPGTMEELLAIPGEMGLAIAAVEFFLNNPVWSEKDTNRVWSLFRRFGWNMFTWKYYRASRAYLGGYKALSACLKLKRL